MVQVNVSVSVKKLIVDVIADKNVHWSHLMILNLTLRVKNVEIIQITTKLSYLGSVKNDSALVWLYRQRIEFQTWNRDGGPMV